MMLTHMLTQWGQFIDHDITFTPEEDIHDCCSEEQIHNDRCYPIRVGDKDSFYHERNVKCLEFSR